VHQMGGGGAGPQTGPRHGNNGGQQSSSSHHSTGQPGSHHANGSRFGTGFPGAISSSAAFGAAAMQSDDQSFKDQQERERQKALEQAKNFLNPQNKPPAKLMMSKTAKDSVDSTSRNNAKTTEAETTSKDKEKNNK
jgi:hypothetical protein